MSASSDSEAAYNEFYDKNSVSNDSDYDLLIPKRPNDEASSRVAQRNGYADASEGMFTTGVGGLLAPFKSCCLGGSYFGEEPLRDNRGRNVNCNSLVAQTILDNDDSYDEPSSETSSDHDDVALGAVPQIVDMAQLRKQYKDSLDSDRNDTLSTTAIADSLMARGIAYKELCVTDNLDGKAKWVVSVSLEFTLSTQWLTFSEMQLRYLALKWCSHVELNEPINLRALKSLMHLNDIPKDVTVQQALKLYDDFFSMDFIQLIEARLIEEIMGEFHSLFSCASNTTSVYLIIANLRTVVISCRQQGDVFLIHVFDTGISKTRGPAFLAFESATVAEEFLIHLFTLDPRVKSSTQRFKAWTLRTRPILYTEDSGSKHPYDALQASLATGNESNDTVPIMDPQYNAKLIYGKMYNATDAEVDDYDAVYTRSHAGGVDIQKKKNKK